MLGGDAEPADEVGEGVGAASVSPGKGPDRLVDLRGVSGLLRCGTLGLLKGNEGALVVAVQQVSPSKVDPVMPDLLTRSGSRQPEFLSAFNSLGAVQHLHGQTDRPDVDVGGTEAQPVISRQSTRGATREPRRRPGGPLMSRGGRAAQQFRRSHTQSTGDR